jgi:3-phenylpropionate/cinnamic acid dioxygenase small subunit
MLLASFTLLRTSAGQKAANDPARLTLLAQKEELEQKIDVLKYGKAAMDPLDYRKQLTEALVQLAKVQAELDK